MQFEYSRLGTLLMLGAIGAIRSWLIVPQPLVVVENIRADQYAAAYGLYGLIYGIICVLFVPFVGMYDQN